MRLWLLGWLTAFITVGPLAAQPVMVEQGPFIGHLTPHTALIWARLSQPATPTLIVCDPCCQEPPRHFEAEASEQNDCCAVWSVAGLQPERRYRYAIKEGKRLLVTGDDYRFVTPPPTRHAARVKVAFGSCAAEDEGTSQVWDRMGRLNVDAVVLLGDTPYIDTTDLATQRRRYREFASVAAMRSLLCHTSWYGVWDDHDFGRNDVDGRLPGKAQARRAFIEYHANPSYGAGSAGIYTSFRRGPVEVFLLDTRWFAATEPSPVDSDRPSLLGQAQWAWLTQQLKASEAPFKLMACGMIWNSATRPNKQDHWGTYSHEREALFRFIGDNDISGVMLVGGDIHRCRVLRHDTSDEVGYELMELISSPMHGRIIEAANAPHAGLVKDLGVPHMFMLVTVDSTRQPSQLEAQFIGGDGEVHFRITRTTDELSKP